MEDNAHKCLNQINHTVYNLNYICQYDHTPILTHRWYFCRACSRVLLSTQICPNLFVALNFLTHLTQRNVNQDQLGREKWNVSVRKSQTKRSVMFVLD